MKPGILHAWLASLTELAAGLGLVVGLLTPLAAGAIFGVLTVAFDHQPPQGRVLRVPPPDRGVGVPDEPDRGVHRDRRASVPGRWSLDNAVGFHPGGWWGLAIVVVIGFGGTAGLLAVFWRPPAPAPADLRPARRPLG